MTKGFWIKAAIFATGVSGLVAEFVLSTLASYFIGDTIVQWTVVLSIMLFAMGVGSRLSRFVQSNILQAFVRVEIILSLLISFSPLLVYLLASESEFIHLLIYGLALLIGACIGFEIPLATRLNESHEHLGKNISNILSWDYIGSLIGGLAFAFWGLPHLGIKNTAFVFGFLNLVVAVLMYWNYKEAKFSPQVLISSLVTLGMLVTGFGYSEDVVLYGEQSLYKDKIVHHQQTKFQKIVITQWKDHFWLFINGNHQLSTYDEYLYHEPMVHPVMALAKEHKDILIIGGGDGFNAMELLKYPGVDHITLVDLDPAMPELGKSFPGLVQYNDSALHDPKVKIISADGFTFLEQSNDFYDLVIVDLPDAKSIEINKLYSLQFYQLAHHHLRPNGHIITQAGSPYYATRAFYCIEKSMQAGGFQTLPMHNQVLTLGEWGWIVGSKSLPADRMKALMRVPPAVETRWFTEESVDLITSFGKPLADTTDIRVNTINDPVLYQYYLGGTWDTY